MKGDLTQHKYLHVLRGIIKCSYSTASFATMTNQDEVPPQAHIGHPTIRIRLIGPVALIHPIHAPTRAQLTPAGDLLHPHDHMNIFNISPLSKFDHVPWEHRMPLPKPKIELVQGRLGDFARCQHKLQRLYSRSPQITHLASVK